MRTDGHPEDSPMALPYTKGREKSVSKEDQYILSCVTRHLEMAITADGDNHKEALDDYEFLKGDQWPAQQRRLRESEGRPCLTINKIPTFLQQITNDQRQNRANIKVSPVSEQSSQDTANIIQGMIKHIEYDSSADAAYDTAVNGASAVGFGFFRICPEYEADDSFEQKLMIKRIRNAFTVHFDPASVEADGSDAGWVAISNRMTKQEFKAQYPHASLTITGFNVTGPGESLNKYWMWENFVRVVEYYCIKLTPGTLYLLGDGSTKFVADPEQEYEDKDSEEYGETPSEIRVGPEAGTEGMADPREDTAEVTGGTPEAPEATDPVLAPENVLQTRRTVKRTVMWYLCTPFEILERTEIKCRWIPVFPVWGTEIDVDGKVYRAGIIRNAKDPARMYNFWMTSATEEVSMRPKSPYIGAEGTFEGHEKKWREANVRTFPYLEYKPVTVDGQLAPPPARQAMADVPTGILAMAAHASDNIKQTTGLFDSSLGAAGNATSGKQELAQQKQGSVTNMHYMDNFFRALRHAGRCLIEMIPHYYDTERIVRCRGDDGSVSSATINKWDAAAQKYVNDVRVGKYDVAVTPGPSYATMRAEAADAMIQFGQSWPKLMDIAGDKVVKAMNWPGADEIAERIARTIPANLKEGEDGQEGPAAIPPEVQQQIQQLQAELQQAQQDADKNRTDLEKARIQAQSSENVARIAAESRADVEELKGLVSLLLAKMPPPAPLAEEVSKDLAQPESTGSAEVPAMNGGSGG